MTLCTPPFPKMSERDPLDTPAELALKELLEDWLLNPWADWPLNPCEDWELNPWADWELKDWADALLAKASSTDTTMEGLNAAMILAIRSLVSTEEEDCCWVKVFCWETETGAWTWTV